MLANVHFGAKAVGDLRQVDSCLVFVTNLAIHIISDF